MKDELKWFVRFIPFFLFFADWLKTEQEFLFRDDRFREFIKYFSGVGGDEGGECYLLVELPGLSLVLLRIIEASFRNELFIERSDHFLIW